MFDLTPEWRHQFVVESNRIDPQPGINEPGHPVYDHHLEALQYAIQAGERSRFALPRVVHSLLLQGHPQAAYIRRNESHIGINHILPPGWIPRLFWDWNRKVHDTVVRLRLMRNKHLDMIEEVWDLHAELMNIRPYELYNGKTGRILMVNHALLIRQEPRLILFDQRESYFDLIRYHPTAAWGMDPPEV